MASSRRLRLNHWRILLRALGVATLHFDFELSDPGHLDSILAAVRRVDSIYEVSRVLPGKTLAH